MKPNYEFMHNDKIIIVGYQIVNLLLKFLYKYRIHPGH